jgi:hypothetical protein
MRFGEAGEWRECSGGGAVSEEMPAGNGCRHGMVIRARGGLRQLESCRDTVAVC